MEELDEAVLLVSGQGRTVPHISIFRSIFSRPRTDLMSRTVLKLLDYNFGFVARGYWRFE